MSTETAKNVNRSDPEPGLVDCQGYRRAMSPADCLKNQASLYCLDGFPCHDCPEKRGHGEAETGEKERHGDAGTRGRGEIRMAGTEARPTTPKTENRKQKTIFKWPKHLKNATAAVRRAWLDKEINE